MKRTPEELKKLRADNMAKARAAAAEKRRMVASQKSVDLPKQEAKMHAPSEFLGLTKKDCPVGCNEERCIITGKPICGHPHKGGIQPILKIDPSIVSRYNRAVTHLDKIEFDKRHD